MTSFPQVLRGFWRERSGLAALEFALVLPLAVAMLFGEFVLGEALSINRKVSIAARTITDLVARKASISNAELATIMNASMQIAAPYASAGMTVLVAELSTDAALATTITWSSDNAAMPPGNGFNLPAGMAQANSALIYTKVTYNYTPPVGQNMFGTIPISNTFYLPPRTSAIIQLTP
jgi:Flp pilus assembly protein TadG